MCGTLSDCKLLFRPDEKDGKTARLTPAPDPDRALNRDLDRWKRSGIRIMIGSTHV